MSPVVILALLGLFCTLASAAFDPGRVTELPMPPDWWLSFGLAVFSTLSWLGAVILIVSGAQVSAAESLLLVSFGLVTWFLLPALEEPHE